MFSETQNHGPSYALQCSTQKHIVPLELGRQAEDRERGCSNKREEDFLLELLRCLTPKFTSEIKSLCIFG